MTYTAFKAHPAVRIARRMVDVAVIIFIATHGIYARYAHTTAETWEERALSSNEIGNSNCSIL